MRSVTTADRTPPGLIRSSIFSMASSRSTEARSSGRSMSKLEAGSVTGSMARSPFSTAGEAPSISMLWTMKASCDWMRSTMAVIAPVRFARRVSSASHSPANRQTTKAGRPTRNSRRYSGVSHRRFSR